MRKVLKTRAQFSATKVSREPPFRSLRTPSSADPPIAVSRPAVLPEISRKKVSLAGGGTEAGGKRFRRPGVIAMASGSTPTVIAGSAVLVLVLIGVTVPEPAFVT
jgi:hypothetical protein